MIPYTMCNGCVFSETENNEQIGCRLNRADKIGIQFTYPALVFQGDIELFGFINGYFPNSSNGMVKVCHIGFTRFDTDELAALAI